LSAALVNGASAHALDYDDTHMTMMGHPSVPVIPAVLALAETEGAGGRAILEAIVAGIELECRLGAIMGGAHYAVGFHSTGTLGTFGAAAACAHLLQLDESQWRNALGLAGTQAAGLKSGFGTMAKPLHAGRAASNGLLSALAARGGFTANPEIVETKQGFAATHSGKSARETLDQFAGRFLIRDTLFKYHASCYLTHAPIQAARWIRAEHRIDPASISSVEVHVEPGALNVCNIQEPRTGLDGAQRHRHQQPRHIHRRAGDGRPLGRAARSGQDCSRPKPGRHSRGGDRGIPRAAPPRRSRLRSSGRQSRSAARQSDPKVHRDYDSGDRAQACGAASRSRAPCGRDQFSLGIAKPDPRHLAEVSCSGAEGAVERECFRALDEYNQRDRDHEQMIFDAFGFLLSFSIHEKAVRNMDGEYRNHHVGDDTEGGNTR